MRIHTHIGSGSDPAVWQHVAHMSLDIVRQFPDVTTLNLGGGYKVGRMSYEKTTDLQEIGEPVCEAFEKLFEETGRKIHLEIEPGTSDEFGLVVDNRNQIPGDRFFLVRSRRLAGGNVQLHKDNPSTTASQAMRDLKEWQMCGDLNSPM